MITTVFSQQRPAARRVYDVYKERRPPRWCRIYSVIVCVARARGVVTRYSYSYISCTNIIHIDIYICVYTRRWKCWWWMRFSIHEARTDEMKAGGRENGKENFSRCLWRARGGGDWQQKRHRRRRHYIRVQCV